MYNYTTINKYSYLFENNLKKMKNILKNSYHDNRYTMLFSKKKKHFLLTYKHYCHVATFEICIFTYENN